MAIANFKFASPIGNLPRSLDFEDLAISTEPSSERDFWDRLEYRVCRELAGVPELTHRKFWCDGFLPRTYRVTGHEPCILGRAWIHAKGGNPEWEFELHLPRRERSASEINYGSLLPAESLTGWLTLDEACRRITMTPGDAILNESGRLVTIV